MSKPDITEVHTMDNPTEQDIDLLGDDLDDTSVMWFGKYIGKKFSDIPDSYFYWLYNEDWVRGKFPGLYDYCEIRLEDFNPDAEGDSYTRTMESSEQLEFDFNKK